MAKRNKRGNFTIFLGLLLIAAAFALTAYNYMISRQAADASEKILQIIRAESETEAVEESGENGHHDREHSGIPLYQIYPDYPMPVRMIDGYGYIGTLDIPALSLSLPVMSEWSYPGLRIAPGRYTGSVYSQDIVIAAHNYDRHFGRLKSLIPGDEVTFTDMDQNVFQYQVTNLEQLGPTEVPEMTTGDWDMTLFTCTYGGQSRVTIRCELTDPVWAAAGRTE